MNIHGAEFQSSFRSSCEDIRKTWRPHCLGLIKATIESRSWIRYGRLERVNFISVARINKVECCYSTSNRRIDVSCIIFVRQNTMEPISQTNRVKNKSILNDKIRSTMICEIRIVLYVVTRWCNCKVSLINIEQFHSFLIYIVIINRMLIDFTFSIIFSWKLFENLQDDLGII